MEGDLYLKSVQYRGSHKIGLHQGRYDSNNNFYSKGV